MKLLKAEITNFRSIDRAVIDFSTGTQALLGLNEAGKSNVLRALATLDPNEKVTSRDLRLARDSDANIESGMVRFELKFDQSERDILRNDFLEALCIDKDECKEQKALMQGLVSTGSLGETTLICEVEIPSNSRRMRCERNSLFWEDTLPGWVENVTSRPITATPKIVDSGILKVDSGTIKAFKEIPAKSISFWDIEPAESDLIAVSSQRLCEYLEEFAIKRAEEWLPKCVAWRYSDNKLLPTTVNISEFCASPESCEPLLSMFELQGYEKANIASVIDGARQAGFVQFSRLLSRVAASATKQLLDAWPDYGDIKLELRPDGDVIHPLISNDQLALDMANRSDGFRRFVSFLLLVSAKVRAKKIQGALLLIDEPEIALHPSGCRNLMNELIRLGSQNAVVYSTHSIFMVDKETVSRHQIVEKKNEVTTLRAAGHSDVADEEILYAALGYSIFETLKQNNVIFEGWRDKQLFRLVSSAISEEDEGVRRKLLTTGITHVVGVKEAKSLARFMELTGRPVLIVSDADAIAVQHQKEYCTQGAWGTWKTLKELGLNAETCEDFYDTGALIRKVNIALPNATVSGLKELRTSDFEEGRFAIANLNAWLNKCGITEKNSRAEVLNWIKDVLFLDVKPVDLKASAKQFVHEILSHQF